LDQAIKLDKKNYASFLERGRLHLDLGNGKAAIKDFEKARGAKDKEVKVEAYIGLAETYLTILKRTDQAIENYRIALIIDPESKSALYIKAKVEIAVGRTEGHKLAREALNKILLRDLEYKDSYGLWRDSILDQSENELRDIDKKLEAYLADHPDSASWRLDLAWDRFRLGGPYQAMETLNKLKQFNPGFHSPEIPLLEARCSLDQGDSAQFQSCYDKAIDLAAATGNFTQIYREAEAIFSSKDYETWKNLKDDSERKVFLRIFWARLDPDPLKAWNSRLVEHYKRLRYAERHYRLLNPHSPIQTMKNINLWLSFQSYEYYYDSSIFFNRCRYLALDPRGMLYVRFGPPDKLQTEYFMPNVRRSNPLELWNYDKMIFLFEKLGGAADYIYRPGQGGRFGDMMKAMEKHRWTDETVNETVDYIIAQFLAEDSNSIDLEFYQDEALPLDFTPSAEAVIMDTLYGKITMSESPIYKIPGQGDSLWLAVHQASVPPEKYKYFIKVTASPQVKWVGRGDMDLRPFYKNILSYSGVIMGTVPEDGTIAHTRRGIKIMPRPSMVFKRGELINVYTELYYLREGSDGQRSYKQYVDVIRLQQGESKIKKFTGKIINLLTSGGEKPATVITLLFDRKIEKIPGPVIETFTFDTANLSPGSYRLIVEAKDNESMQWASEEVFFDIVNP